MSSPESPSSQDPFSKWSLFVIKAGCFASLIILVVKKLLLDLNLI